MTCSWCSETLPDGARFCPSCGHPVATVTNEERRVVSILFADIVGFTTLSEHLDPERVKRLVDGGFELMIEEIERFGGRVDKVMGDGILALFGAPTTHEDDPERAVRAAIEMHRRLRDYVATTSGITSEVRLRVGINTGEVVVGTMSHTDDYTAMGDAVNVAARLQSMAPAGGTYVGSSTAALLSPSIARVLVADTVVRGREQTEQVWQVTGRVEGGFARTSRHDLPFVGRHGQRDLLASVMALVANGQGAVVSVSGEAGSGKTRLVNEALSNFPARRFVVFAGVCAPYGENNVWAPIADALYRLIDIDRSDSTALLGDTIRSKGLELYGFDDDDPRLHRFVEGALHLFGHPSELDRVAPSQAREILMQVVVEGLHRRSQSEPVVVWLDDLQWADPLLIELLERLTRSLVDRPVLLVTAHREDAEIAWPPRTDHPIMIRMPLDPLSRAEADELVRTLLDHEVAEAVGDALFERSGGNPLFLTQLAQRAQEKPGDHDLPGTLRALIAARLDALPTSQRLIVDNASVLGTAGLRSSLSRFAEEMGQAYADADFDALVDDGIFDVDVEGRSWRFRSDIVREVAYRTLTKSSRAQRHVGVAEVMGADTRAPIDQVAHHAASAAELAAEIGPIDGVPADVTDQAVALLTSAARRSIEIGAFHQAVRHATRALELGVDDADTRRTLRLLRANAHLERREGEEALADAEAVRESAVVAGDMCHEAIACRVLGMLAQHDGDLERARELLTDSVTLLEEVGDEEELATSLSDRGFVEVFGGSLEEADRYLSEAEELSDRLGDRRRLAWIRQHQAWVAFLSGDTGLAEQRLVAASGLFGDLGDRSGSGWAFGLLAYVRFFERRLAEAEELANAVREEALDLGERWAPAMMDALVASIRLWTGRFSEAEELSRRALTSFRDLNDRFGVVQALGPRLRALVALGRDQEAERGLEEAVSLADSFGHLAFPTMAAAGTAAHLGLGERAVSLGEIAVERTLAMRADASEARVCLALGLCQVGRAEDALTVLLDVSRPQPFSQSVNAVAHAMLGDFDEAIVAADAVADDDSATYLDRILAGVAGGAASLGLGDDEDGDRRLAAATATADRVGDEVARALAHRARNALLGDSDVAVDGPLGSGWRRVVTEMVAAVARESEPAH